MTRDLYCLQTYAIQLDIGLWGGDKRKMEIAESFLQPVVTVRYLNPVIFETRRLTPW